MCTPLFVMPPKKKKKAGGGGRQKKARTFMGDTVRGCLMTLGIDNPSDAFSNAENIDDEFKIIKRSWHKKVLECHPDKGGSEEEFRAVQAAFDVLKDKKNSGTVGTFGSSSAQSASTSSAFKHASDAAANCNYPGPEFYENMRENINVPLYRVEIARSDRSICHKAAPKDGVRERVSGYKGSCRFGLGEICHPVPETPPVDVGAAIGDGTGKEGPAPKKKRGRPAKPKPKPPHGSTLTGDAYVDWAVKIPMDGVRVGSIDPVSGNYARWSHVECWRVPSKIHQGLPNPHVTPDPAEFERALLSMNDVLFCGFDELTVERRARVVAAFMDTSSWASGGTLKVAPVAEADVVAADEEIVAETKKRTRGRPKKDTAKEPALTGKKRARATFAAAEKAGKAKEATAGKKWTVEEVLSVLEAAERARPKPEPEPEVEVIEILDEPVKKGKVKTEPVVKTEAEIDWASVHAEMQAKVAGHVKKDPAPVPVDQKPGKVKPGKVKPGKVKKEPAVMKKEPVVTAAVAVVKPKKQKPNGGGFIVPRPSAGLAVANVLAGKTVVLTGVFPQLGGGQGLDLGKGRARAMIESFGGRVTSAVSGKTDVLLVGTDPGMSKVSKARGQPGCMVVSLEKMCELLHAGYMLPDKGSSEAEELTKTTKITSFSAGYQLKGGPNSLALKATPAQLAYAAGVHLNDGAKKPKKPTALGWRM